MKSLATVFSYFILLLLMPLKCFAVNTSEKPYELEKRFVDDTEIYEYVNSQPAEETKQNITFVLDNSGSMSYYSLSNIYEKGAWNNLIAYQVENDNCTFCDHRNYITTDVRKYIKDIIPNLNHVGAHSKAINKLYLRLPKFKNCSSNNCEMLDGENVLIDIAGDFLYPDLYFDGVADISKYDHVCTLFMKEKARRGNRNQILDNKKISFPVESSSECVKYKNEAPSQLENSNLRRFFRDFTINDDVYDKQKYNVDKIEVESLCENIDSYKKSFADLIRKNSNQNSKIGLYFDSLFKYKDVVKPLLNNIYNLESEMYELQRSIDKYNSKLKWEEGLKKENEKNLSDYKSRYGERLYDKTIKDYNNRIKENIEEISDLEKVVQEKQESKDLKSEELASKVALIEPYSEAVIEAWKNNMADYLELPDTIENVAGAGFFNGKPKYKIQGCAIQYLKNKKIHKISTFQHRNFIKGTLPGSNDTHLYSPNRYEIMIRSLEFAFENFLPDQTDVSIVPFNVYDLDKNKIKESKYIVESSKEVKISYNGEQSKITMDEEIRNMPIYGKVTFDKSDPNSKKNIISQIKYHSFGGNTPTTDALVIGFDTAKRNLQADGCYDSNKIVLFTDGDANQLSSKSRKAIKSIFNTAEYTKKNKECDAGNRDVCNVLLAELIGKPAHKLTNGNKVKIPIYAIGFKGGLTHVGEKALNALSQANRGEDAILVETLEDMQNAFSEAVSFAELTEDVTVSPASPPTAGGGVSRGETAFFGLFKPNSKPLWNGNIKCYKVDLNAKDSKYRYKDSKNKRAFCAKKNDPSGCVQSGQINPASKDYFNLDSTPDGDQVFKGGIRSRTHSINAGLDASQQQKLSAYTDKSKIEQEQLSVIENTADISDNLKEILIQSFNKASQWVAMPPSTPLNDELFKQANNWLAGFNEEGTELRSDIGDLLHTEITVLNYQDDSLMIAPSNDGFLRAYKVEKSFKVGDTRKADFGELVYSFIPRELFDSLWWRISSSPLKDKAPNITKFYGFDGSITPVHFDTNLNGVIDNKEKAFVIVGMRRGGNSYYLFDVSNPFGTRNRPEPAAETDTKAKAETVTQEQPEKSISKPMFKEGIQLVRRIGGVETYLNRPLTKANIKTLKTTPTLTDQGELKNEEWSQEKDAYRVLAQTWSKPTLVKLALSKRWPRMVGNAEVEPPEGCNHAYCYAWIFGGGYNPNVRDMIMQEDQRTQAEDYTNDQDDYIGNAIYMINAATGKLLWWASSEDKAKPKQSVVKLESVPGAITTINVGGDNGNATDAGFFFDIEGGLFRINFYDFKADITYAKGSLNPKWDDLKIPSNKAVVRLGKLGKLNSSKQRFAFYEPAVTYFTDAEGYDFFAIGFGTGYRPSPKLGHGSTPDNIIGVLFDYPVYEPKYEDRAFSLGCGKLSTDCLINVTTDDYLNPRKKLQKLQSFTVKDTKKNRPHGWYIKLNKNKKEKVISAGKAVSGYLAIESFIPKTSGNAQQANQCVADLGERRIWVVDLKDGHGYFDNNKDRFRKSGQSLPAERLGVIRHNGDYLITGTRLEEDGQDAVKVGSGIFGKQELGWREAIPKSSIFSQKLTLPGATTTEQ